MKLPLPFVALALAILGPIPREVTAQEQREHRPLFAALFGNRQDKSDADQGREERKEREVKLAAERERARQLESEQSQPRTDAPAFRGLFSNFRRDDTSSSQKQAIPSFKNQRIKVRKGHLDSLTPENALLEISILDQRARLYKTNGDKKQLVIDTYVSTGKNGYATPTGSFSVKEKLKDKRSTLYGEFLNSSGQSIGGGHIREMPSHAARFQGTEMPYWLRIDGPIGLHVGPVPNYPASHGCIRVPASIQPLIFSKVDIGTPVVVTY